MQDMVNAIRGAGATQPILLGGLDYANDLSQWLANEPSDPLHQLVASFHNYDAGACNVEPGCLDGTILGVAAQVPVVTGEFGDINPDACQTEQGPDDFNNHYMNWADQHGISYLAFAWVTRADDNAPGSPEITCAYAAAHPGAPFSAYLVSDPAGTPAPPLGVEVHAHLLALAAAQHGGPGELPPGQLPRGSRPRQAPDSNRPAASRPSSRAPSPSYPSEAPGTAASR